MSTTNCGPKTTTTTKTYDYGIGWVDAFYAALQGNREVLSSEPSPHLY